MVSKFFLNTQQDNRKTCQNRAKTIPKTRSKIALKIVQSRAPARTDAYQSVKIVQKNAQIGIKMLKKTPKINRPSNTSVNISYNLEIGGISDIMGEA